MLNTSPRVIVISGANRGIGAEAAKYFLNQPEKHCLSLGARNTDQLQEVFGSESDRLQFFEYQADDDNAAKEWAAAVYQKFGHVTDLYNNAGCSARVPFMSGDVEAVRRDFNINAVAPWLMMEAFMPYLEDTAKKMDIVTNIFNAGSLSGARVRTPGSISYAASKFALVAFNDAAAVDCFNKKNGVRVTLLVLDSVNTEFSKRSASSAEDKIPAYVVAEAIDSVMKSPGQVLFQHLPLLNGYQPRI